MEGQLYFIYVADYKSEIGDLLLMSYDACFSYSVDRNINVCFLHWILKAQWDLRFFLNPGTQASSPKRQPAFHLYQNSSNKASAKF